MWRRKANQSIAIFAKTGRVPVIEGIHPAVLTSLQIIARSFSATTFRLCQYNPSS
jgi:hypothetical protein